MMPLGTSDGEFGKFLEGSYLCDLEHPLIKSAARRIAGSAERQKDVAIEVFYFVRDKILLAMVNPWKKASETLKMERGSCLTKATLQVTLMRSLRIPARFKVLTFRGDDPAEWEGILPSLAVSKMPREWPHYLAETYVDGRWIMADATFDKGLLPSIEDWKGDTDLCTIDGGAILSDRGSFASIEEEAKTLDAMYRAPVLWNLNSYRFFWIINLYQKLQRLKNRFQ